VDDLKKAVSVGSGAGLGAVDSYLGMDRIRIQGNFRTKGDRAWRGGWRAE